MDTGNNAAHCHSTLSTLGALLGENIYYIDQFIISYLQKFSSIFKLTVFGFSMRQC